MNRREQQPQVRAHARHPRSAPGYVHTTSSTPQKVVSTHPATAEKNNLTTQLTLLKQEYDAQNAHNESAIKNQVQELNTTIALSKTPQGIEQWRNSVGYSKGIHNYISKLRQRIQNTAKHAKYAQERQHNNIRRLTEKLKTVDKAISKGITLSSQKQIEKNKKSFSWDKPSFWNEMRKEAKKEYTAQKTAEFKASKGIDTGWRPSTNTALQKDLQNASQEIVTQEKLRKEKIAQRAKEILDANNENITAKDIFNNIKYGVWAKDPNNQPISSTSPHNINSPKGKEEHLRRNLMRTETLPEQTWMKRYYERIKEVLAEGLRGTVKIPYYISVGGVSDGPNTKTTPFGNNYMPYTKEEMYAALKIPEKGTPFYQDKDMKTAGTGIAITAALGLAPQGAIPYITGGMAAAGAGISAYEYYKSGTVSPETAADSTLLAAPWLFRRAGKGSDWKEPEALPQVRALKKELSETDYNRFIANLENIQSTHVRKLIAGIKSPDILKKLDVKKLVEFDAKVQNNIYAYLKENNIVVKGSLPKLSRALADEVVEKHFPKNKFLQGTSDVDAYVRKRIQFIKLFGKVDFDNMRKTRILFQLFGERFLKKKLPTKLSKELSKKNLRMNYDMLTPQQRIAFEEAAKHNAFLKGSPTVNLVLDELLRKNLISKKQYNNLYFKMNERDIDFNVSWRKGKAIKNILSETQQKVFAKTKKKYDAYITRIHDRGKITEFTNQKLLSGKWTNKQTKKQKSKGSKVDFELGRLGGKNDPLGEPWLDVARERGFLAPLKQMKKEKGAKQILDEKGRKTGVRGQSITSQISDQINRAGFQHISRRPEKGLEKLKKYYEMGLVKDYLATQRLGLYDAKKAKMLLEQASGYKGRAKLGDVKDYTKWEKNNPYFKKELRLEDETQAMNPWTEDFATAQAHAMRGMAQKRNPVEDKDFQRLEFIKKLGEIEAGESGKRQKGIATLKGLQATGRAYNPRDDWNFGQKLIHGTRVRIPLLNIRKSLFQKGIDKDYTPAPETQPWGMLPNNIAGKDARKLISLRAKQMIPRKHKKEFNKELAELKKETKKLSEKSKISREEAEKILAKFYKKNNKKIQELTKGAGEKYRKYTPYTKYRKSTYTQYTKYSGYNPYAKYAAYKYTPYGGYGKYSPYSPYSPYTPYSPPTITTYTPYNPYTPGTSTGTGIYSQRRKTKTSNTQRKKKRLKEPGYEAILYGPDGSSRTAIVQTRKDAKELAKSIVDNSQFNAFTVREVRSGIDNRQKLRNILPYKMNHKFNKRKNKWVENKRYQRDSVGENNLLHTMLRT